jgi:hypothetical protein
MTEPIRVDEEITPKIAEWLATRGGVQVWESADLGDPGWSCFTPVHDPDGKVNGRPHWKAQAEPVRVVTDVSEVEVVTWREVKRFHVATQVAHGLMVSVTPAGSKRIRREVAKAGDGAAYRFDYAAYENVVIVVPDKVVPLERWLADNPQVTGRSTGS